MVEILCEQPETAVSEIHHRKDLQMRENQTNVKTHQLYSDKQRVSVVDLSHIERKNNIAYQNKDITSKVFAQQFKANH